MVVTRTCRILPGREAGKHRFLGNYDSGRMFPQLPGPFDVLSPQTYGGTRHRQAPTLSMTHMWRQAGAHPTLDPKGDCCTAPVCRLRG